MTISGSASAKPRWDRRRWDPIAANVFTIVFLGLWQAASMMLPPFLMPSPLRVAENAIGLLTSYDGLMHISISLAHVAAAMLISFLLATLIALLPYYFPVFTLAVDGRITPFLNCFPAIGWTMIAIVWLGIGFHTVVFSVSVVLLPFMIINLRAGVASLDNELLEMGYSFTRSRWLVFSRLIAPLLTPFAFASARVGFGVAWKVTLTAELLGGGSGLGYLMNVARSELNTPAVIAIIVVLVAFVYLTNRFVLNPLSDRITQDRK